MKCNLNNNIYKDLLNETEHIRIHTHTLYKHNNNKDNEISINEKIEMRTLYLKGEIRLLRSALKN